MVTIPVRHRKGPPSQKAECNNTYTTSTST